MGERAGRGALVVPGGDPEEHLAPIADRLCEGWLDEEIWRGWPMCSRHPSRPMWAKTDDTGIACWVCESDDADKVAIGQLAALKPPDSGT